MLEQAIENVERVADRPGDDDGVKPGELVAREVVVGDASAGSKVPRVRTVVEGSDRYDEAKPVGRGDLASAPVLGQGDRHLAVHKSGVGLYQGLLLKVNNKEVETVKTTTAVEKQPVRSGAVAVLTPAAAALACASISENTRLTYQSALNRLQAFLQEQVQDLAGLTDRQLAEYLGALHEAGTSPATASLACAAVRFLAKTTGQPSPAGPLTGRVLAGLRRRRQSQHPTRRGARLCPMSRALAAAREGRPTGCSWRRRHPGAAMRCEAVLERRT